VAAQGARGLRLIARIADGWNTLGGQPLRPAEPVPMAAAVERTREQVRSLERSCHEFGRDPKTIRRSVLAFRTAVDPLSSVDAFDDFVGRYTEAGIDEFVFYWPPLSSLQRKEPVSVAKRATLERIAADRVSGRL
jgi:alkanesulfonate monooxygenase SsuD/methylene tetrahydromethanopterin reductase-like flavin-dependent oxidoreductase (luciferase family)